MTFKTTLLLLLFAIFLTNTEVKSENLKAGTAEITDISVHEINNFTEIHLNSNSPIIYYTVYESEDPYKIVLELRGVDIGKFKDKVVVDKSGVVEIIPTLLEDVKGVRFEIILSVPAQVKAVQKDGSLVLAFYNPDDEKVAEAAEGKKIEKFLETHKIEVSKVAPDEETASVKEDIDEEMDSKSYTGKNISLDFQDAELIHIFRLLADVSGYNIVVSPQVKGKFSVKLTDVPWKQALDIILRNYGLSKIVDGNIIRVAPTTVITQEEEEIARAKEAKLKSGDLETRAYAINYADVKKILDSVKDVKTERGKISIDERTSTIIIKDVPTVHREIEKIIKSIDLPTSQVSIEAKIIEVTSNFTKELGIQWGMLWKSGDVTVGGTGILGGTGFTSDNPLIVNFPAAVGPDTGGGAIGLGYINSANTFTLDLQLSAMESTGKGKIISNPRITTMDNREAKILQGRKIPYQTFSANEGTKTEFVDANLELKVTPHITPEGTIIMNIEAKKNEADFSQTVGGIPTIDTKEAKTEVLIRDGDTLVIGGIFKTNISKTQDAVPALSKIPLLGWLFKKEKDETTTTELLMFITPRVVKEL